MKWGTVVGSCLKYKVSDLHLLSSFPWTLLSGWWKDVHVFTFTTCSLAFHGSCVFRKTWSVKPQRSQDKHQTDNNWRVWLRLVLCTQAVRAREWNKITDKIHTNNDNTYVTHSILLMFSLFTFRKLFIVALLNKNINQMGFTVHFKRMSKMFKMV